MRNAYRWKESLGPNEQRSGHMNGKSEKTAARSQEGLRCRACGFTCKCIPPQWNTEKHFLR